MSLKPLTIAQISDTHLAADPATILNDVQTQTTTPPLASTTHP